MATEEIESVKVRGLTLEGVGIGRSARHDKIHVYGSIPGEITTLRITGKAEGVPYGVPHELIKAHPARRAPSCEVIEECLGCPAMAFPEEVQQSLRAHLLNRVLTRVAKESGLPWPEIQWERPEYPERWARKVRYRYRVDKEGRVTLGFYRPDRSTIQDIEDCAVAESPLTALLANLRHNLGKFTLPSTGQIVAAMDDMPGGSKAVVCLRAEDKHFPDPDWCEELAHGSWPVRGLRLIDREFRERFRWGDPTYVYYRGEGSTVELKATVGLPLEDDPRVVARVMEILQAWLPESEPYERVLELFAGVGVYTSHLYRVAERVDAVTTPAHALDDLHANFQSVPTDRVQRAYASISRGLGYAFRKKDRYDLVCAWVPMRGAIGLWRTLKDVDSPRLITSHAALEKTAADLRRILEMGYRCEALHAFAAEPHRGRVSLLARWGRSD